MDEQLTRRRLRGEQALAAVWGYPPHGEDRHDAAKDAISDLLTAVIGQAGHYNGRDVEHDEEAFLAARKLISAGIDSWRGDAEDYETADTVTVTVAAVNPDTLLNQFTAPKVTIRSTGDTGGAGGALMVEVTGTRHAVHAFIAEGWGAEEADDYVAV